MPKACGQFHERTRGETKRVPENQGSKRSK